MLAVSVPSATLCCDVDTLCTCWEFDRNPLHQIGCIPLLTQAPSELFPLRLTLIRLNRTIVKIRRARGLVLTIIASRYCARRCQM